MKKMIKMLGFIAIIVCIALLARYAWARYIKTMEGTATANIAKFSIKVNGQTDEEFELNFAETMNSNSSVSSGYVAPGTSGAFTLEIDATESDVSVDYYFSIDVSKKPTNLLLYSDSSHANLMDLPVSNKIISIDSILVSDATKTKSTTIYWDWQYETGGWQELIEANDAIDNKYMEKEIVMPVQVKAVQKNGNGPNTYFKKSFADTVHVGDYVNYDATSGDGAGRSITPSSSLTGSGEVTTFNSSDIEKWRVYDINSETGEVILIAADPTSKTLKLSDKTGWKNVVDVLNSVGDIYGHGKGATGGRCINERDISSKSKYNPANYKNTSGHYYYTENTNRKETETYTNNTFIMDDNSEVTASLSDPVTMRQTYYEYTGFGYIPDSTYNLIFIKSADPTQWKPKFWVATRIVDLGISNCYFGVRCVGFGGVGNGGFYDSSGIVYSPSCAVVPMVTLQSNIEVSGTDANGVWLLDFN